MFGNKAKHALAAAQAENAQLKAQADTLQGELAATQARLAQLETQARECPEFCVNQPLLFDQSIVGFGLGLFDVCPYATSESPRWRQRADVE